MKCYKCGNEVKDGSIFCLCCGADLLDCMDGNNGKPPQENEKTEYEVIASASGAEKTVRISENEANANKKSPYDPVKPDLGGQVFWQPSDDEKDKVNGNDKKNKGDSKKIVIGFIAGIAAALIAVLVVTKLIPAIKNNKQNSAEMPSDYIGEVIIPPSYSDCSVGDIITFGSYEQDNNTSNGKELIEWQVLAKEDNKILVISKYALDCRPYNAENTKVTWETCSIRTWLNNDFLFEAFSLEEQKQIQTVWIIDEDNPFYFSLGGNDTQDMVFLLSFSEAKKYFDSDSTRMCVPTDYAKAQGAWTNDSAKTGSGETTCLWWLRSPGYSEFMAANINYAADVSATGFVSYQGASVSLDENCVRPALWISFDS